MKLRLLLALCIAQLGFAQEHRTCGTDEYMQRLLADPVARQNYEELQARFQVELERLVSQQMQNRSGNEAQSVNATIRIPVAVHFPSVANSSTETVKSCLRSLAQAQVNILNADYNATNTDLSLWTAASSYYPGVNVGNMDVQFIIATQNHPAGTGLSNGTLAVTFGTDFLSNADTDTTWAGYCNLVVRNISGGILGYSPLGGSPSGGMTVVIDNNAFGKVMTTSPTTCSGYVPGAPYNLGRTLTHELGHFFNLWHTFEACDGANCATSGDRVCDTPSADTPYFTCDAPGSVSTNCGTTQLTMNYMDYVEDACMYMFTAGQATRMTAWYNAISSQLNMSALANNEFVENNFTVSPNPNNGTFTIELKEALDNYTIQIYDATGRLIIDNEYYQNSSLSQTIKMDNNALSGVYFVSIRSAEGGMVTKKVVIK